MGQSAEAASVTRYDRMFRLIQNRVADQIQRKNLPIEFPAAEKPREAEIQNQVQQPVINFRRMNA